MFLFGFVFPDMMNANSLRNKVDREKVTFKNKITIYKMNTISFWIGVFVFCTGITSVIKYILLTSEINQLGILIITFSLGVFNKLFNTNRTISKLLK